MNTADFRTRTIFKQRKNVSNDNYWGVALDVGYSSVKGFSPNSVFSFPAYAEKFDPKQSLSGNLPDESIFYKDNATGEVWLVGSLAQDLVSIDNPKESVSSLYGRNRYFSPIFKIVSRVGLALACTTNQFDNPNGRPIALQTGLPPAYAKADTPLIIESFEGRHDFDIRIGNGPWLHYDITIPSSMIYVIGQPIGTLFSISLKNDGTQVADARKYFKSNILIFDPGFNTFDLFAIKNGMVDRYETLDTLGMKRVLQETTSVIMAKYGKDIPIQAMQKCLSDGSVTIVDKKTVTSQKVKLEDILDEANKKVCKEALDKTIEMFNYFSEYEYLVLTGGTGAAWNQQIRERLSGMETLQILSGNQNDELPYIFANVRGYYLFLINTLQRLNR